jgi:hypothetical protein
VIANLLHANGMPDLAVFARSLDQRGGRAEAGEGQTDMFAPKDVLVVAAHACRSTGLGFVPPAVR